MSLRIFTDGACSKDGRGGWAWVYKKAGGEFVEKSGGERGTTNNRMELKGVIWAATHAVFKSEHPDFEIISDSKYVVNGINEWVRNWQINDWKTADGKDVKNKDLWEQLLAIVAAGHHHGKGLAFSWVKGHAGDEMNERADALAVAAAPR